MVNSQKLSAASIRLIHKTLKLLQNELFLSRGLKSCKLCSVSAKHPKNWKTSASLRSHEQGAILILKFFLTKKCLLEPILSSKYSTSGIYL